MTYPVCNTNLNIDKSNMKKTTFIKNNVKYVSNLSNFSVHLLFTIITVSILFALICYRVFSVVIICICFWPSHCRIHHHHHQSFRCQLAHRASTSFLHSCRSFVCRDACSLLRFGVLSSASAVFLQTLETLRLRLLQMANLYGSGDQTSASHLR